MTLREQMQADMPMFFNPEEMGEEAIYRAKGFAARTINVTVDDATQFSDASGLMAEEITFIINVERDGERGIVDPQPGDELTITRGGKQIIARYAGVVQGGSEFGWTLMFTASTLHRVGGNVMPQ